MVKTVTPKSSQLRSSNFQVIFMEVFGIIAMSFGVLGFIFGLVSFIKIQQLTKIIQKNGLLKEEIDKV